MLNLLSSLFGAIVPSLDADPEVQYMWRLKIAGVVSLLIIALPLMVMAATGHIWGFEGFTPERDFKAYLIEARKLREERIRVDLLALQASRCKSPTDEGRRLYTQSIDSLENQYFELTGRYYPTADCKDL